jgi:hypothetical protein
MSGIRRGARSLGEGESHQGLAGTDMLTSAFAVAVTLGFVNFRRPLHQRSKAQCTASAAPA